jgi:hypothetical protein
MESQAQGHAAHNDDEFWASPSVWWRWETEEEGDSYVRWMVRPPCGHHFILAGGSQSGPHHEVDEEDNGIISVVPKPTNSNSILCPQCGWHGFIEHGVWKGE